MTGNFDPPSGKNRVNGSIDLIYTDGGHRVSVGILHLKVSLYPGTIKKT